MHVKQDINSVNLKFLIKKMQNVLSIVVTLDTNGHYKYPQPAEMKNENGMLGKAAPINSRSYLINQNGKVKSVLPYNVL